MNNRLNESFTLNGGAVVQIPEKDDSMTRTGPFDFHAVPEQESWVGAASFFYHDSPLLSDLCGGSRLEWEFKRVYPTAVSTGLDKERDEIHAGYVEGWLAHWGSPLVVRPFGDGTLTVLTFKLPQHYGDQPAGTLVCNRLIRYLTEQPDE